MNSTAFQISKGTDSDRIFAKLGETDGDLKARAVATGRSRWPRQAFEVTPVSYPHGIVDKAAQDLAKHLAEAGNLDEGEAYEVLDQALTAVVGELVTFGESEEIVA